MNTFEELLLTQVATPAGSAILAALQRRVGDAWKQFPSEGKVLLSRAAIDLAKYTILSFAGRNVDVELALTKSSISNWSWVGADIAKEHLADAIGEVVGITLGIVVRALIK